MDSCKNNTEKIKIKFLNYKDISELQSSLLVQVAQSKVTPLF